MKRGWWTDDDGFLRSPDNVTAYALDDCVKLLDDKDAQLAEAVDTIQGALDLIEKPDIDDAAYNLDQVEIILSNFLSRLSGDKVRL